MRRKLPFFELLNCGVVKKNTKKLFKLFKFLLAALLVDQKSFTFLNGLLAKSNTFSKI